MTIRPMPSRARSFSLLVHRDGQAPYRLRVTKDSFRIGRSSKSDLLVPEAHISNQHAEIRVTDNQRVLIDTQSRAGVMVNGTQISSHVLQGGDIIQLGNASPVKIEAQYSESLDHSSLAMTLTNVVKDDEQGGMGRLARFFEFSNKLRGGFSLDEVLQDVVDLAIDLTKAERGLLIFKEADGSIKVQLARDSEGASLRTDALQLSDTLVQNALTTGKPQVIEDVNQDIDLAAAASIVMLELRSAVTLPLVRYVANPDGTTGTSEVSGLIYLDSRSRHGGFDGFDMHILERLAQDASSVMENARLFRESEEQKRMARDVEMAGEIQAALMPDHFISTPMFEIAGTCLPCHELGGDYIDQFDLGDGRQALVVADVCGKGIGASLLAATLQGALASEIGEPRPLGEIVARLNRVHCRLAPIGKFITMVAAITHPDGAVDLVNAGHCPIFHAHANGVDSILTDGMGLGLDEDATYKSHRLQMQPNDSLLLYTDGVGECEGHDRELFGEERLKQIHLASRGQAASQLLKNIMSAVDDFRGDVDVSDDLSVLVVCHK